MRGTECVYALLLWLEHSPFLIQRVGLGHSFIHPHFTSLTLFMSQSSRIRHLLLSNGCLIGISPQCLIFISCFAQTSSFLCLAYLKHLLLKLCLISRSSVPHSVHQYIYWPWSPIYLESMDNTQIKFPHLVYSSSLLNRDTWSTFFYQRSSCPVTCFLCSSQSECLKPVISLPCVNMSQVFLLH